MATTTMVVLLRILEVESDNDDGDNDDAPVVDVIVSFDGT